MKKIQFPLVRFIGFSMCKGKLEETVKVWGEVDKNNQFNQFLAFLSLNKASQNKIGQLGLTCPSTLAKETGNQRNDNYCCH